MTKNISTKTWSIAAINGARYSSNPAGAPTAPAISGVTVESATSLTIDEISGQICDTLTPYYRIDGDTAWIAADSIAVGSSTYTYGGLSSGITYNLAVGVGANSQTALSNVLNGTTTAGGVEWQLASGHYESYKIAPQFVAPLADANRSSYSRYGWASTQFEYEVPVVVLGGSYPFFYEIRSTGGTADTSTATIGASRTYGTGLAWYGSANQRGYGILRWTPAVGDDGKTFSFTVRATGQDGSYCERTFGGTVQNSKFKFVDIDAVSSGDGTLASPYKDTTDGWWGDGNHADKIMVYRGRASAYAAWPTALIASTNPRVHIRYPSDTDRWILTGTTRDYTFDDNIFDWWVSGQYVAQGPGTSVTQARFYEASTGCTNHHRSMYWDNYFYDGRVGSAGSDNNAWIVHMGAGYVHNHTCIIGNTFDTSNSASNGFGTFTFFSAAYFVFEHNIIKNWTGETIVQPKDSCSYFSIRANNMWENNTSPLRLTNQDAQTGTNDHQEVCWNFFRGDYVRWNDQTATGDFSPQWLYRNTIYHDGGSPIIYKSKASWAEYFYSLRNAVVGTPGSDPYDLRLGGTWVANATDAEAAALLTNGEFDTLYSTSPTNYLNLTTGLMGSNWTSYAGLYGASPE